MLYLDGASDAVLNSKLGQVTDHLRRHFSARHNNLIVELLPAYQSLLVVFDPLLLTPSDAKNQLASLLAQFQPDQESTAAERLLKIPVCYDEEFALDADRLISYAKLSYKQIVRLHSETTYRVYALGFAPGFAYLGDVDPRIAAPRLATPRALTPKGSLAIADRQTAIYPADSPGGWNILGRSPLDFFDPDSPIPVKLRTGDQIQFQPIDRTLYSELQRDPDRWEW